MRNVKNVKNVKRAFAFIIAAAAMAFSYMKMGIFFETNDDRLIAEILSGTMTQAHSAFVHLVNCFLSLPLFWLYQVTGGGIPWYGGSLIFFHVISYTVIFAVLLNLCHEKGEMFACMLLCVSVFCINIYCVGLIQWTSTAALLALAGYVCLLSGEDRRSVLVFAGLELTAFLLRDEAMLMVQPLGGAVFAAQILEDGKWKEKKQWNMILSWGLSLAGIFVIGMLGKGVERYALGWQDGGRYNTEVALRDYYGFPPYEEVKDILDKYQVTRTEYEGLGHYVTVGFSVDADCLSELAEYAGGYRVKMISNGRRRLGHLSAI